MVVRLTDETDVTELKDTIIIIQNYKDKIKIQKKKKHIITHCHINVTLFQKNIYIKSACNENANLLQV